MDAGGEVGHHVLPARAFGCGDPGVLEAVGIDADDREELLEQLQAAAGKEIARGIVAVPGVAAGNEHAVGAVHQRLEHEQRVDAPGAWDTDDTEVRRLRGTGSAGSVGAAVGTPVAQEPDDTEFFTF